MKFELLLSLLLAILQSTLSAFKNEVELAKCGSHYGCFFHPTGCDPQTNCITMVTFQTKDNQFVEMLLAARSFSKTGPQDVKWVAVGFSNDQEMGDEPVTACFSKDQTVMMAYNSGKSNQKLSESEQRIMIQSHGGGNEDNNLFYCRLIQRVKPSSSGAAKMPDLSQPYYVLMATGETSSTNELNQHVIERSDSYFPVISSEKVAFTEVKMVESTAQPSELPSPDFANNNESPSSSTAADEQLSTCASRREKAAVMRSKFVPECDEWGNFVPVQCDPDTKHCWCVGRVDGAEVPGSRRTENEEKPTCEKVATTEQPAVQSEDDKIGDSSSSNKNDNNSGCSKRRIFSSFALFLNSFIVILLLL